MVNGTVFSADESGDALVVTETGRRYRYSIIISSRRATNKQQLEANVTQWNGR